MKTMLIISGVGLVLLSGCGEPAMDFSLGVITGATVALEQTNDLADQATQTSEELAAAIPVAKERLAYLKELLKENPVAFAYAFGPEFGAAMAKFMLELERLKEQPQQLKAASSGVADKVNPDALAWLVSSGLLGGVITNLYKNNKAEKNGK